MTLLRYSRTFIAVLGADFPKTSMEVLRLVRGDAWRFALGAESVLLLSREGRLSAAPEDGRKADAQCSVTLGALRGLMRSELSVVQALATEELALKGEPDSLLRMGEALHLVFDSIPRSRGLERLASRFWRAHGMDGRGRARGRPRGPPSRRAYRFGLIPVLENGTMEGYDA